MRDELKQFLLKFNRFKPEEIDLIIESSTTETFKKGDLILAEGDVCKKCYLVVKGCLRQFQTIDDIEKTTGFFMEGDPIVSYSSYLHARPSAYSIHCLENTTLISGSREKELEMHAVSPALEFLAHTIMVDDFKKAEHYISLLNNLSPEERYLALLKNNPEILNRVPLIHVASYLGITPESLSRIRKRILLHKD